MPAQPSVHIRSLRIRVPGTDPAPGQALAAALRAQLGDLPATHSAHLGALNLRVPAPDPASASRAIASALARHLAAPPSAPHA